MKKAGVFLIVLAGAIIFWNVVLVKNLNEHEANEHPFVTIFSGGSNLKNGYTFAPPFSGFELLTFGCGIAGVVLVFMSGDKKT